MELIYFNPMLHVNLVNTEVNREIITYAVADTRSNERGQPHHVYPFYILLNCTFSLFIHLHKLFCWAGQ